MSAVDQSKPRVFVPGREGSAIWGQGYPVDRGAPAAYTDSLDDACRDVVAAVRRMGHGLVPMRSGATMATHRRHQPARLSGGSLAQDRQSTSRLRARISQEASVSPGGGLGSGPTTLVYVSRGIGLIASPGRSPGRQCETHE
jgi:hypothetical protein